MQKELVRLELEGTDVLALRSLVAQWDSSESDRAVRARVLRVTVLAMAQLLGEVYGRDRFIPDDEGAIISAIRSHYLQEGVQQEQSAERARQLEFAQKEDAGHEA